MRTCMQVTRVKPFGTGYSRGCCSSRASSAARYIAIQSRAAGSSRLSAGPTQQTYIVEEQGSSWAAKAGRALCIGASAVCLALDCCSAPALAARGRQPPITESATRCDIAALDVFADTRAKFSQESAGGNMTEAVVDVRGCDFSNQDLSGKVFSAVMLQGANLANSKVVGSQFARADAKGAVMSNVDFTDANCFGTSFDGADMQGAQFENSILTGATFGKDSNGNWANLKGAHFEGALLSSSDVGRVCENPTLEPDTKRYELGCRTTK